MSNLNHGHCWKGGASHTYHSWRSMRRRSRYGYCKALSHDPRWDYFPNFLEDMGERPEGMTLDRIDNEKGYSKDNCRWATALTQTRNRSIALTTIVGGESIPIMDAAKQFGLTYYAAVKRVKRGQALDVR